MKKLQFTITIQSPKSKVWDTMLNPDTYNLWTTAFTEGSHYEGSWEQGANIAFLDPNRNGMVALIAENRTHERLTIKHIGIINKGVVDTDSPEVKAWVPAFETYNFSEKEGQTTVTVEIDTTPDYEAYMGSTWPKALQVLKTLCENTL